MLSKKPAKTTTVSAVLLLLLLKPTEALASNELSSETTDACASASVLNVITAKLEGKLTTRLTQNELLLKRTAQATAAVVQAYNPSLAKAARAMLPTLHKALQAATANSLKHARQSIRGVVAAANLTGYQLATSSVEKLEIKTADAGNTNAGSITGGAGSINFKNYEKNGLATCQRVVNAKHADFDSWASPQKLKKFKIFVAEAQADGAGTARAPAVGGGSGSNCVAEAVTSAGVVISGSNICVAGGKIFKTTATELDATADADYGLKKLGTYDPNKQDHYFKQAANDISTAATTLAVPAQTFNPDDLSSFTSDDDFIAVVGAIYADMPRDKATGEAKNTVNSLITNNFGKPENFKTKIWDKIEELKVPATVLGEKKEMTLKDVDDIGLATQIMVQHITDSLQKLTSQAEKQPDTTESNAGKASEPPKTVDECKKHTTEKPCKDEKGCDFDDKKPGAKDSFQNLKLTRRMKSRFLAM
uniref:Variant surface glycoprotein (VSG), putative n=1 Tax=Trypanosoma brucei brucei (strain 927/4 GUTat10.1) TaxID=185431 RepID=Q4FKM2_TRYB2|nr:variant surface glycoprotein (VSG), putative [Trypanosoma brucei brucei TREU927]